MRLQNALAFLLFDPAGNIALNGLNVSINAAGALNFTGASGAALVSGGTVLINGAEV
jgi:hypothetical protein